MMNVPVREEMREKQRERAFQRQSSVLRDQTAGFLVQTVTHEGAEVQRTDSFLMHKHKNRHKLTESKLVSPHFVISQ